jgi:hypothetical protein
MIDQMRELEDVKSAAAAKQARIAVAYELAARQEQAAAGVPTDEVGAGVGSGNRAGPSGVTVPWRPVAGFGESPG